MSPGLDRPIPGRTRGARKLAQTGAETGSLAY